MHQQKRSTVRLDHRGLSRACCTYGEHSSTSSSSSLLRLHRQWTDGGPHYFKTRYCQWTWSWLSTQRFAGRRISHHFFAPFSSHSLAHALCWHHQTLHPLAMVRTAEFHLSLSRLCLRSYWRSLLVVSDLQRLTGADLGADRHSFFSSAPVILRRCSCRWR